MKSKDTNNQSDKMSQPKSELGSGGADHSKRRLLKGIITTAPVVMAISSKPALANFCGVSGFLSGNLSHHNADKRCGGYSHGHYKQEIPETDTTTFYEVFHHTVWEGHGGKWGMPNTTQHTGTHNTHSTGTPTFHEVLWMQGNEDTYMFGAHAIAAYLNAHNVPGYGLEPDTVREMVRQIIEVGVYTHPGTGKTLDAEEFAYFIDQTYH